jgi:hypothetical protein
MNGDNAEERINRSDQPTDKSDDTLSAKTSGSQCLKCNNNNNNNNNTTIISEIT